MWIPFYGKGHWSNGEVSGWKKEKVRQKKGDDQRGEQDRNGFAKQIFSGTLGPQGGHSSQDASISLSVRFLDTILK